MGRFAEETTVSVEQTRAEIEKTLNKYGADAFAYGRQGDSSMVGFQANDRQIKFILKIPPKDSREFTHSPNRGIRRSPSEATRAWEQGCRQRWRALLLAIKAKLEAVESGIATFEQEFLAYTVLPGGQTVGDRLHAEIENVYRTGQVPQLLLGGGT